MAFERLAASEVWHRQRAFYTKSGHEAFAPGGIPFQITSNPAMAHAYASVVAGWLSDQVLRDPAFAAKYAATPLLLLEVGPGTGRFTYLFTRELRRLLAARGLAQLRTCLVCADVSEPLLRDLHAHPALRELAAEGLVGFAVFDAEQPAAPQRLGGGADPLGPPLVVIANYLLDSLKQDCFYSTGSQLYESQVEPCGGAGADPYFRFEQRPVRPPYYCNAELDGLLERSWRADPGLLQFPVGALRLLQWLWDFTDGQMLLLAADKGYYAAAEMLFPAMEGHGDGCVSMMVNFRALEQFWLGRGGRFLKAHREGSFLSFAVADTPANDGGGALLQGFTEHFADCTPEDWSTLGWRAVRDVQGYGLAEILALLRLARWDPVVFRDCFPTLLRGVRGASAGEKASLCEAATRTAELYYFLGEVPDTYFLAGSLVYEAGKPAEALQLLERSTGVSGETPTGLFQRARCLYHLARRAESLALCRRALEQEPKFEDYLLASGILPERRAAWLVARLEWETSLPAAKAAEE